MFSHLDNFIFKSMFRLCELTNFFKYPANNIWKLAALTINKDVVTTIGQIGRPL